MNSPQDQIQALIADIDEVLSKPSPRLPWMASVESVQQRQILERIRSYLSVQEPKARGESFTTSQLVSTVGLPSSQTETSELSQQVATQQIVQAVMGEISYLRANLTQPLQQEIQALRQEQQRLIEEIKQLEIRRQQDYSLAQQQANQQQVISEFLQVLMNRLQDNLTRDVAQAIRNIENQFFQVDLQVVGDLPPLAPAPHASNASREIMEGENSEPIDRPLLSPAQRVEQVRLLQRESDRLLMRLDSTLNVMFEALHRNVQSYQEALSQGLEKMHSLGQQGEAMFTVLVNHLAEQLGREASSYVHTSLEVTDVNVEATSLPGATPVSTNQLPDLAPSERTQPRSSELSEEWDADDRLPYPGTELSPQFAQLKHDREEHRVVAHDPKPTPSVPSSSPAPLGETSSIAEVSLDDRLDGEFEDAYESLFPIEQEATSTDAMSPIAFYEEDDEPSLSYFEDEVPGSSSEVEALASYIPEADESLEDFLVAADSEFAIANSATETPRERRAREIPLDSEAFDETFDLSLENEEFVTPVESETLELTLESEGFVTPVESETLELTLESEGFTTPVESEALEFSLESEGFATPVESETLEFSLESEGFTTPVESETLEFSLESEGFTTPVESEALEFSLESEGFTTPVESEALEFSLESEEFATPVESETLKLTVASEGFATPLESEAVLGEVETLLDVSEVATLPEPIANRPEERDTVSDLREMFVEEVKNQTSPNSSIQPPLSRQPAMTPPPPPPPPINQGGTSQPKTVSAEREEDLYIQASPDENLLPIEEPEAESDSALLLDTSMLQLLQTDLFSLEGLDDSDLVASESSAISEDFSVFSESLDFEEDNPFVVSAEEEVATLEDLFTEISQSSPMTNPYDLEESGLREPQQIEERPDMTLEDILTSLTEAEPATNTGQTTDWSIRQQSTGQMAQRLGTPDREKKKVDFFESELTAEPGQRDPLSVGNNAESATTIHAQAGVVSSVLSSAPSHSDWYLGIDFGTTRLSAALLNRASGEIYPIYWDLTDRGGDRTPATQSSFHLPSAVNAPFQEEATQFLQIAVEPVSYPEKLLPGKRLLKNFKPFLKVGISYARTDTQNRTLDRAEAVFEPIFQWSQQQTVSLAELLHALRSLLVTFNPSVFENQPFHPKVSRSETGTNDFFMAILTPEKADAFKTLEDRSSASSPSLNAVNPQKPLLRCHVSGLEADRAEAALKQLEGVILGCPAGWSEAYRFNLREAVLAAGLVAESSRILVIEDAIAALLAELTPPTPDPADRVSSAPSSRLLQSSTLRGGTLILCSGAISTELALVDLPEDLSHLTYSNFTCRSFPYAGQAIDQDIICQLLLKDDTFGSPTTWPRAGYHDLIRRYELQQRLQSSALGRALLAAATHLKVILQHQERFHLKIGERYWELKRRDLESKVLLPFVQHLNRELNDLLSQVGLSPVAINQVICTGGTGSWPAIARWLRQKLPNAVVIHDSEDFNESSFESRPSELSPIHPKFRSSRIAWGLASLPLYPQVLDRTRQQYSDYFLLCELMRTCQEQSLNLREIMQRLEHRGINTRTCQPKILSILEGKSPLGLLPSEEDLYVLITESRQNPDYKVLKSAPLFYKGANQEYQLNQPQATLLWEYLHRLIASSQQKLEEPLFQPLATL